ncbi:YiiX/YebB-like N1pC/P60 family cysteine hydrolase [Nioella aestuarii]|uniref:YiiX/YebB-like N1pC/P60 family cysteine hydrolase n=1 Tax=Nioella aestuarii TaxID=1662864 RepID=UPI003D7FB497
MKGWRAGVAGMALLGLAGCSDQPVPADIAQAAPADITAGCCQGTGSYPDWMIELADANVGTMRRLGLIQFRPGRMTSQPEATALLQDSLRPMDLVFFHSDNRVSGLLIPGQFTHGATYIGTETQLREAGLWHLPELVPFHQQIRDGNLYLEAVDGGVRLAPAEVVLDTDAVVALRPPPATRATALRRGMDQMGTPFDMRFDAGDASALFCAELIALMFAEAELPRTAVPGRETILIDRIVAGALAGDLPFALVGYIEATPGGGARVASVQDLAWDLRRNWPD